MKPLSIGIVGGAGPLASAKLLDYLVVLSSSTYGCYQDADYPEISLLSYPFSDMLSPQLDERIVREELGTCLQRLRNQGAAVLAIACNTLHNFLDQSDDREDFVNLPRLLKKAIPKGEVPLVLCTSTSRNLGLHKGYYSCAFPSQQTQVQVDEIIDRTLQGQDANSVLLDLLRLIEKEAAPTIILGCTELSLYAKQLSACGKTILDPLEVTAKEILEKSFKSKNIGVS
jgi:aspartate racemase